MRMLRRLLVVFLLTALISPAAIAEMDTRTWKRISFEEAVAGKFRPLDLELSLPPDFIVRASDRADIGSFLGREEDLRHVLASEIPSVSAIEHGVFQIFWSMRVGYFAKKDKFSGEDDAEEFMLRMGITTTRNERKTIGGYPTWIHTGKTKEKVIQSCYIATLNGTNVFTILYYPPPKPNGEETAIWNAVIASIGAPPYKKIASPDGVDAMATIQALVTALKPTQDIHFKIAAVHTLGPTGATKRPTINQTAIFVEDQTGLKSIDFDRTSSNNLVEGNNETLFGRPWDTPRRNGQLNIMNGNVVFDLFENGNRIAVPPMPAQTFQKKNQPAYVFLSGTEMMVADPLHTIMADVINLFDFVESRRPSEIVLTGRPNEGRLQNLLDDIGMPREAKGRVIVDEMMKRWSKATIRVDPDRYHITSFIIEGVNQMQPFQIEIRFEPQPVM